MVFVKPNGLIIGFKLLFDQLYKTDLCSEFFYQKKTCIGEKIVTVQRQCHLLKRKIIEIYPPSAIGLVYLKIYRKTDASRLTKNSSL